MEALTEFTPILAGLITVALFRPKRGRVIAALSLLVLSVHPVPKAHADEIFTAAEWRDGTRSCRDQNNRFMNGMNDSATRSLCRNEVRHYHQGDERVIWGPFRERRQGTWACPKEWALTGINLAQATIRCARVGKYSERRSHTITRNGVRACRINEF